MQIQNLFQEHVKPPIMIEFKTQYESLPLTMSVPVIEDVVIHSDRMQVGNFYAIKAETEEGFLITKCLSKQVSDFVGSVLKKSSESYSFILYKQTDQTETFGNDSVFTSLISVVQKSKSKIYCVSRNEYEDLMLSINS